MTSRPSSGRPGPRRAPTQGRFADQGTTPDSSNGFSQALGILALLRTTNGVPSDAVTFLLGQQCPDGGFRLFYDTGATCTANSDDDPDATGLAVQALAALPAVAGRHGRSRPRPSPG